MTDESYALDTLIEELPGFMFLTNRAKAGLEWNRVKTVLDLCSYDLKEELSRHTPYVGPVTTKEIIQWRNSMKYKE